jgi:HSP20 family protein
MRDDVCGEFDAMFAELARRVRPGRFEPNCDVYLSDDDAALVVKVEIAGAEPSELRVLLEERYLFIVGVRNERERGGRGSLLMKEIEYGDFVKKIHLPTPVADSGATALYRDGILTIRLPVSKESYRPTRRTEIRMTVKRIPV